LNVCGTIICTNLLKIQFVEISYMWVCDTWRQTTIKHQIPILQSQNHRLCIEIATNYTNRQCLNTCPTEGSSWLNQHSKNTISDSSKIGIVYEVDILYPLHLQNKHNVLPFLLQNSIPPCSKIQKLMATLEINKSYIVQYRNIK